MEPAEKLEEMVEQKSDNVVLLEHVLRDESWSSVVMAWDPFSPG